MKAKEMPTQWHRKNLLNLSEKEKLVRFDKIVKSTFFQLTDSEYKDYLRELHPRKTLDIKRRVDGVETWFEGDWLSNLMDARDGRR